MTNINQTHAEKTLETARIIAEIAKAKKRLAEHALKEAPFQMKLNGITIISNEYLPEGTIMVTKDFADTIYTAFTEKKK